MLKMKFIIPVYQDVTHGSKDKLKQLHGRMATASCQSYCLELIMLLVTVVKILLVKALNSVIFPLIFMFILLFLYNSFFFENLS